MTGKHTQGPWELKTERNCLDEYDCYLYPIRLYIPENVSEADAKLLAAAPDLLEALEAVMTASGEYLSTAFEMAQDALTKAKGRPWPDA